VLFLYKHVHRIVPPILDTVRAKRPKRLPVVLSREEVKKLLRAVEGAYGIYRVMTGLMYGSGLRLMECCRLRVQEIDLSRGQVVVREAKGDKDRAVSLPESLGKALVRQIEWRVSLHQRDLARGLGRVDLPGAFERKSDRSAYELGWQYVFASERISRCPRTSTECRLPDQIGRRQFLGALLPATLLS
jgi:integrase